MNETKESPSLLDRLTIILGVIIVVVILLIIALFTANTWGSSFSIFSYNCESFEEQVENTNKAELDYYLSKIDTQYDTILVSPIGVQFTLYEYYNSNKDTNPAIFSYFDNGYKSWGSSGDILSSDCFNYLLQGSVTNNDEFLGKLQDLTDGYITSLGESKGYDFNKLLSIFSLNSSIKDAMYCEDLNTIIYSGVVPYKQTSDYEAIKLQLSDGRHSVYLIDGNISEFSFDDFNEKDCSVMIDTFVWQSYGSLNGLATMLNNKECELNILTQFGFRAGDYETVDIPELKDDVLYYVNEYSIIIQDDETGLILALGKRN